MMTEKMNEEFPEQACKKKKSGRIGRILKIIECVVLIFGLGVLIYIFVSTANGKAVSIFGKYVLHITTGSMNPTIEKDAYVLVKKCDADNLKKREIIAYYTEDPEVYGQVVVHRIMDVREDGTFVTKGDANPDTDTLSVRKDQIIGKYESEIWFFNWLTSFADVKKLLLILAVLPMFFVSVYEFSTVTKLLYRIKNESYQEELKSKGIETAQEKIERLKREAIEEYLKNQNEMQSLTEKADDVNGEKE